MGSHVEFLSNLSDLPVHNLPKNLISSSGVSITVRLCKYDNISISYLQVKKNWNDLAYFSDLRIKSFDRGNRVSAAPTSDREKNFSFPDRLSRSRPRTLHVRTLLWEKEIILGLVNLNTKVQNLKQNAKV